MISSGRGEVDPAALHARQAHRMDPSLTVRAMPPSGRPIRAARRFGGVSLCIGCAVGDTQNIHYGDHRMQIPLVPTAGSG